MQEPGYALRRLGKTPGFTAAAVVTLALGIGANTATFSVLYAGFFAPYAIDEPERLLRLYGEDPGRDNSQLNLSVPKFELARAQQTVFTGLDAANYTSLTLLDQGDATQVTGAWTTAGFLQTFGARPLVGRFFAPTEEKGTAVAVISETLWRRRFAGDPAVVGRTLTLPGATFTIVGVAPRLPAFWQAEVWLTDPFQLPGVPSDVLQRGVSFLATVGRLAPGITRERAASEMDLIASRYREERKENADAGWRLVPLELRADIVGTSRSALGAPRARIVRQFLLESVTVSVLAGVAGTALAVASLPALATLAAAFVPFSEDIRVHVPVLAATLVTALLTGLLMGAYPAVEASRCDLVTALHEGGRAMAGGRAQTRMRNLLVSGQVAVSLLLLVAAGLLIGSFAWLHRQPPGYRADGVFIASLTLPPTRYPEPGNQGRFFLRLAAEMRAAPSAKEMEVVGVVGDVRSVTLANTAAVEFYRPVMQRNLPFMQLAVRTEGDPAAFAGTARAIVKRLDPELALSGSRRWRTSSRRAWASSGCSSGFSGCLPAWPSRWPWSASTASSPTPSGCAAPTSG